MRLIDADALSLEGTITDIVEEIINAPSIDQATEIAELHARVSQLRGNMYEQMHVIDALRAQLAASQQRERESVEEAKYLYDRIVWYEGAEDEKS